MSKYPEQPPPYGFQAPPQPQMPTHQPPMIQPTHVIVMPTMVGPQPHMMTCPNCHQQITTRTEPEISTKTHLFAAILCLLGCWCCAPIPYCTDSCMNMNHYCPRCNAFLGAYTN